MLNEISILIGARRKKKSSSSIVPASFFKEVNNSKTIIEKSASPEAVPNSTPTSTNSDITKNTNNSVIKEPLKPTITTNIPISKRAGSALSLKSIQQKKEFTKKKVIVIDDPENLPKNEFTEEQALKLWNDYGKRMDKKGERIIGSMFAMNKPTLQDNFTLLLELPNETMRIDVESISKALLAYMHEELNNYSINLKIDVNEVAAVKHAFTPEDKYNKLKERNPLIDLLRTKLDLDI